MTYNNGGDSGDFDSPDVFHQELVSKSKLNHRCTECHGIIEKGESYERSSGIWDGRWSTYRTCERCMALESAIEGYYKGFANAPRGFGELLEDAGYALPDLFSVDHPGRWFGTARKFVAIKRKFMDQISRNIVDKSGRPNRYRHYMFWQSVRDENNILRQAKLDKEREKINDA